MHTQITLYAKNLEVRSRGNQASSPLALDLHMDDNQENVQLVLDEVGVDKKSYYISFTVDIEELDRAVCTLRNSLSNESVGVG